jgi:ABC-type sugar transport system substrate-binding protein
MRLLDVSLIGAIVAAASINSAAASDFKIGFAWDDKNGEIISKMEDYMKSEAKAQGEAAGVNIQWVINVADGDPSRQTANVEDLINQGVGLIGARLADSASGAPIRAANEAGIPFITFDRATTSKEKPVALVGVDPYDEGKTASQALVALLKTNNVQGKCIELLGGTTDVNAVQRAKAWHDVTDSSGVIKTLVTVPTDWVADKFRSGLTDALASHPEANCAFLPSDNFLPAVQAALEGAGRWAKRGDPKHFWIASQDVFPAAVKSMQEGYLDLGTSYDAYLVAKEFIRVAIEIAQGKKPNCPPEGCLVKGRVVTQENVNTIPNLWSRAGG